MPKGKRTCPICGKETGVRIKICDCGHQFLNKPKVEKESATDTFVVDKPIADQAIVERPARVGGSIANPVIFAPDGRCPCKPEGYRSGWPDGPASEEVITEWAYRAFDSGGIKRYTPHAILYWSYQFWDINEKDYKRVRTIILKTLCTPEELLEFGIEFC
jgi:hypothetical protein